MSGYLDALRWHLLRSALSTGPGAEVLAIGDSADRSAARLARLGYRVTLVEASPLAPAGASGKGGWRKSADQAERRKRLVREPEGPGSLRVVDPCALGDLPTGRFGLVLATAEALGCHADCRQGISDVRRLCTQGAYLLISARSRFEPLPALLRGRDLPAVEDLVLNGSFYESLAGCRVRRHGFEIRELLALLWEAELTVLSVLGRSALLGILGRKGLSRLLRELGIDQLIALEELVSQNEYLIGRARRLEVLCQVE